MKVLQKIIILLIFSFSSADCTILCVPEDYPGIQYAINAAADGDKILVQGGEYHENLIVAKSISINGVMTESSIPILIPNNASENGTELLNNGISISGF